MVSKKEFHTSKQGIALSLVDTDKMVVSEKFKYSYNGSKYFIGYLDDDDNIIRPLCIMLPQMRGYIKHFYDSGKIFVLILKMIVYIQIAMKFGKRLKRHYA